MKRFDRKQSGFLATTLNAAVAVLCVAGAAQAQSLSRMPAAAALVAAGFDMTRIEEAFWMCDYLGTTRGPEAVDVGGCIAVSDALRELHFDNDLDRLVAWWREHKPAQHARLAAHEAPRR